MLYEEKVITLATSQEEADAMREAAESEGLGVKGTSVWTGPIPPNSYEEIGLGLRMSTPEFFMFRKANELDLTDAAILFCEMWSVFRTNFTAHNMPKGEVDVLMEPRATFYGFAEYIKPVLGTPEGVRAYEVMVEAIHHFDQYHELMCERVMELGDC